MVISPNKGSWTHVVRVMETPGSVLVGLVGGIFSRDSEVLKTTPGGPWFYRLRGTAAAPSPRRGARRRPPRARGSGARAGGVAGAGRGRNAQRGEPWPTFWG